MANFSTKRILIVSTISLFIVIAFVYFIVGFNWVESIWSNIQQQYYSQLLPKSKKINIISKTSQYRVLPVTSEFASTITSDLNMFDDKGVYVHHRSHTENIRIRELDVIFTDETQFWPGVGSPRQGTLSNFDFTVDDTNKGTVKIWINPDHTVDAEELSILVNRTYFIALYIITNWDTYQEGEQYFEYLKYIDDHISNLPVEDRPLIVTN